jgi:hypothetical protein
MEGRDGSGDRGSSSVLKLTACRHEPQNWNFPMEVYRHDMKPYSALLKPYSRQIDDVCITLKSVAPPRPHSNTNYLEMESCASNFIKGSNQKVCHISYHPTTYPVSSECESGNSIMHEVGKGTN